MKVRTFLLLCAAALIVLGAIPVFGGTALPSVSVSGVTATSPVLRSTPSIAVSASVTATFDTAPQSSTDSAATKCGGASNNYCSTANSAVGCQLVKTTTSYAIQNQSVSVVFNDLYSTSNPPATGTASGTYTSTLNPVSIGTDGSTTVTGTANVAEDYVTTTQIDTTYWTSKQGNACSGDQVVTGYETSTTDARTDHRTGSGTGTGSYVLDINPPLLTLKPDTSQPTIYAGGDKKIHNVLFFGSENTPYTLTDTVSGPNGYTNSADGNGTFGTGGKGDGIAQPEHDLVNVHIACNAPQGTYTASAVAHTVDLGGIGGSPYDPDASQDYPPNGGAVDTFQVLAPLVVDDQTAVVSELPPTNNYAPMTCFTSNLSGRKVSTFPGTQHLTSTINISILAPDSTCTATTFTGTTITFTLPVGFAFYTTGGSPPAHVFIGPNTSGFDFHYPNTLTEATLPKNAFSIKTAKDAYGNTYQYMTVDLSSLGAIPTADTIYARTHVVYSAGTLPIDGTQYVFTTSTTNSLGSNTSQQTLTASSACVNGN